MGFGRERRNGKPDTLGCAGKIYDFSLLESSRFSFARGVHSTKLAYSRIENVPSSIFAAVTSYVIIIMVSKFADHDFAPLKDGRRTTCLSKV